MIVVAARSICGAVRCIASSTTTTRLIVVRAPHPNSSATLTRRCLNTPSSSSTIPSTTEHAVFYDSSSVDTAIKQDNTLTTTIQDDDVKSDNGSPDEVSLPFTYLNDRVNRNTIKALTVQPLQLERMTPVQKRVTALLPDLVRPWDPEGIVPPSTPTPLPPHWKPPEIDWTTSRDILVRAKTGTGKTIAYIIPAIESRLNYVEHHGKLAAINAGLEHSTDIARRARAVYRRSFTGPLVIAPTRELAIQIARDAQKLTTHQGDFEVQLLVGGAGKARQMKDWMESPRDLVVATPGRLRDLLTNEPEFRNGFKRCPMLILDEADTLLSMGFRDDIEAIVSFLSRPPIRQTFLFSATMPRAVRQLASWILSPNHMFIDATQAEQDLTPPNRSHIDCSEPEVPSDNELTTHHHIEQFHTQCPTAADQIPTLLKLVAHDQLTHASNSKVIVFCPTVQMTELFSVLLRSLVEEILPDDTTEILTMHSKMKQTDRGRTRALFHEAGKFPNGRPTVLVTSDVSARGVDYPRVTRVIQIGVPSKEAMYIHRIGRMARGVDSFTPRRGSEASRPAMRADLLLLPWEAGYMKWQLTHLPIKPFPVPVLDSRLLSLSPQWSALITERLASALVELQSRLDPVGIRGTAASLLGYYLPLSPALRLQPRAVLAGVSSWASECFHVAIPPITRFPKKFTEAYERNNLGKTKGLFVDGLMVAGPSALGKAKSKNRSVWEGANTRKKRPKRWY